MDGWMLERVTKPDAKNTLQLKPIGNTKPIPPDVGASHGSIIELKLEFAQD